MGWIKENSPCIPCLLAAEKIRLPSVQHVVEGQRRLGHDFTYASCDWHHFGYPLPGWTAQDTMGLLGPSLAHGKRSFQGFFGPELLLVEIQNKLFASFERRPWLDYNVPEPIRHKAVLHWTQKRP